MQTTTHPTIAKYWSERAWWEQLGLHIDERPLRQRPWREVVQYEVIMQAEAQVRRQEAHSNG